VTVLLVEDDAAARRAAREHLAAEGFQVVEAPSADAASSILALRDDIDVVVTDVELGGCLSGTQLVQLLARQAPWIAVVVISKERAPRGAAFDFLVKPYAPETLVQVVRAASTAMLRLRAH
jgi:DNA-binding NtrC family response regulator